MDLPEGLLMAYIGPNFCPSCESYKSPEKFDIGMSAGIRPRRGIRFKSIL